MCGSGSGEAQESGQKVHLNLAHGVLCDCCSGEG